MPEKSTTDGTVTTTQGAFGSLRVEFNDKKILRLLNRASKKGFREAAEMVAKQAVVNLAPHRKTGWTESTLKAGSWEKGGSVGAFVRGELPTAFLELGHKIRRVKRGPAVGEAEPAKFMRSAADMRRNDIVGLLKQNTRGLFS